MARNRKQPGSPRGETARETSRDKEGSMESPLQGPVTPHPGSSNPFRHRGIGHKSWGERVSESAQGTVLDSKLGSPVSADNNADVSPASANFDDPDFAAEHGTAIPPTPRMPRRSRR